MISWIVSKAHAAKGKKNRLHKNGNFLYIKRYDQQNKKSNHMLGELLKLNSKKIK